MALKKLVAGNWKMNAERADGLALAGELAVRAKASSPSCELLVCPPATLIFAVGFTIGGSGIALGGQDCHAAPKGAFTCAYVIIGHSERRHLRGETDADARAKVEAAWRAGLTAILCVGETRAEREAGTALAVVCGQVAGSLPEGATLDRLVVAYEPVWAIGTGLTPTPADITEIHQAIRADIPAGTRMLYGGSVNPKNAAEILSLPDVDGALVGGASLKADDFWAIAQACE
jgi:triosephosphate isomerase